MAVSIRGPEGEGGSSIGMDFEELSEPLVCGTCGVVIGAVLSPSASQRGLVYHHQLLQAKSDIRHFFDEELPSVVGHDHLVKKSDFQAPA